MVTWPLVSCCTFAEKGMCLDWGRKGGVMCVYACVFRIGEGGGGGGGGGWEGKKTREEHLVHFLLTILAANPSAANWECLFEWDKGVIISHWEGTRRGRKLLGDQWVTRAAHPSLGVHRQPDLTLTPNITPATPCMPPLGPPLDTHRNTQTHHTGTQIDSRVSSVC